MCCAVALPGPAVKTGLSRLLPSLRRAAGLAGRKGEHGVSSRATGRTAGVDSKVGGAPQRPPVEPAFKWTGCTQAVRYAPFACRMCQPGFLELRNFILMCAPVLSPGSLCTNFHQLWHGAAASCPVRAPVLINLFYRGFYVPVVSPCRFLWRCKGFRTVALYFFRTTVLS